MSIDDVPAYLRDLAERTSLELWKVSRRETTTTRLVLPSYRAGGRRVSEQEARSIAQRLVADGKYYFSIETPTDGLYKFTGKEGTPPRSASHDMSLYLSVDPASVAAHIEFKQGHRSGDTGIQVIAKDLEKLVGSARHSLWFHSFPLPTENEFSQLRGSFAAALERVLAKGMPPPEVRIILAFCAVVDPIAWLAGPVAWTDLRALIEQFPVVSPVAHPAWSRTAPSQRLPPPRGDLEFDDHERDD
jgi:hypothetical protein